MTHSETNVDVTYCGGKDALKTLQAGTDKQLFELYMSISGVSRGLVHDMRHRWLIFLTYRWQYIVDDDGAGCVYKKNQEEADMICLICYMCPHHSSP